MWTEAEWTEAELVGFVVGWIGAIIGMILLALWIIRDAEK